MGTAVFSAALLAAFPDAIHAQARSPIVEQAIRHRDAREFEDVVRLLAPYVERKPDDREATRILAQTLYWMRRDDEARRLYDSALVRHPDDAILRLQYARMRAETGHGRHARLIVTPLLQDSTMQPYANGLLGTLAYWEGDFTTARRRLRLALAGDSTQADVRRQLEEIAGVTAPWTVLSADVRTDDQSLTRIGGEVSGAVSVTPLLWLLGRAGAGALGASGALSHGVGMAEAGYRHYAPAARLETEAAVGVLQRGGTTIGSSWTGRARAGFRLPRHWVLRGIWQREPYFFTISSLRTPIMTSTIGAEVALASPRGWSGETSVQEARYPDDNAVLTAYAWLLAPVARSGAALLQAGYGFTYQNAAESRFMLARPNQPFPPGNLQFVVDGIYDPYHTPADLTVHWLLGAYEARAGRAIMRVGGSYGIRATDMAPMFQITQVPGTLPGVERVFVPRSFSPWTARAGLEYAASLDLSLGLAGEAMRTVFYRATTARLWLTYRRASAAMHNITRR